MLVSSCIHLFFIQASSLQATHTQKPEKSCKIARVAGALLYQRYAARRAEPGGELVGDGEPAHPRRDPGLPGQAIILVRLHWLMEWGNISEVKRA